jgi:nitroreductase
MKRLTFFCLIVFFTSNLQAQVLDTVVLNNPDKTRGLPVMEAFSLRASVREWSDSMLSMQDLSDLLWATDGINRPDEGKRTAPSAMNAQDVDLYVFTREGVYLYNAPAHALYPVSGGDHRELPGMTSAPVNIVLVSDISRFRYGNDSTKLILAAMDAGIVSQNIALFCAGMDMVTRPRASFPDIPKMKETLKLSDNQHLMLNHPVGYRKK